MRLLAILLFLLSPEIFASTVSLSEVTTKRIGSDFFIEMSFTGPISEKAVEPHFSEESIDFVIANARVSSAKKMITVKDPAVQRSFIIRENAGARYQLVLAKPYSGPFFQRSTTIQGQGNRLLIRIGEPDATTPEAVLNQELRDAASATSPLPVAAVALKATRAGDLIDKMMTRSESKNETREASGSLAASTENEASLPVFKSVTEGEKNKTSKSMSVWERLLLSLMVILIPGAGAYYFLKKSPASKKFVRQRMIEVLAQHPLGPKKSLAVVRVAGESVLIGVTDQNISILKGLSLLDDDLPNQATNQSFSAPSKSAFSEQANSPSSASVNKSSSAMSSSANSSNSSAFEVALASKGAPQTESVEEFSMKGLKDIVSERLKNMRSLN